MSTRKSIVLDGSRSIISSSSTKQRSKAAISIRADAAADSDSGADSDDGSPPLVVASTASIKYIAPSSQPSRSLALAGTVSSPSKTNRPTGAASSSSSTATTKGKVVIPLEHDDDETSAAPARKRKRRDSDASSDIVLSTSRPASQTATNKHSRSGTHRTSLVSTIDTSPPRSATKRREGRHGEEEDQEVSLIISGSKGSNRQQVDHSRPTSVSQARLLAKRHLLKAANEGSGSDTSSSRGSRPRRSGLDQQDVPGPPKISAQGSLSAPGTPSRRKSKVVSETIPESLWQVGADTEAGEPVASGNNRSKIRTGPRDADAAASDASASTSKFRLDGTAEHGQHSQTATTSKHDKAAKGAASRPDPSNSAAAETVQAPPASRRALEATINTLRAQVEKLEERLRLERKKSRETRDTYAEFSESKDRDTHKIIGLEAEVKKLKDAQAEQKEAYARQAAENEKRNIALQAQRDELQAALFKLQQENDRLVLAGRTEIDDARGHMQNLERLRNDQLVAERKAHMQTRIELEESSRKAEEGFQARIEAVQREADKLRAEPRLAAKEREIERIHTQHRQELESLKQQHDFVERKYRTLQAFLTSMSAAGNGSGPSVKLDPSEAASQVEVYRKQLEDAEIFITSMRNQYDRKIAKLEQKLADKNEAQAIKMEKLQASRTRLESHYESMRGRLSVALEERDRSAAEHARDRALALEAESLTAEKQRLALQNAELEERVRVLIEEDLKHRAERSAYTNGIENARREGNAAKADAALLRRQVDNSRRFEEALQAERRSMANERRTFEREMKAMLRKYQNLKASKKGRAAADKDQAKAPRIEFDKESTASSSDDDGESGNDSSDNAGNGDKRKGNDTDETSAANSLFDDDLFALPSKADPVLPAPPANMIRGKLDEQLREKQIQFLRRFQQFESSVPAVELPALMRKRRPDSRVPKHRTRVYVRSECHTPYVAEEVVSDSDDEFLDWELQAYARTQATNPDPAAATVNVCWHRWILDARGRRVRSQNFAFTRGFVQQYGRLISSRGASEALLEHVLRLVKLGQLSTDEGGEVMKAYRESA